MTVQQAAKLLTRLAAEGHGDLPFCAIDGVEDVSECHGFTINDGKDYIGKPCIIAGTWTCGKEILP